MSNDTPGGGDRRTMVIVTGAGRSGTSSVAGALKQLGFHVPLPEVQGNQANPRGHFEPRWVVNFHARLLAAADVFLMDARPEALDKATEVGARPRIRAELKAWVDEAFVHPRLVIKDPRAFWFRDLWVDAAQSAGADLRFITMLRHPAESVDSRLTHYMKDQDPARRAAQGTTHLAGWINATLANERTSRPHRRAFVQYSELIQDWRTTMRMVQDTLDLPYDGSITGGEHHPIDDFIDPALYRVKATWDDLDLPTWLRDQGEETWLALADGSDPTLQDPTAVARLDEVTERYAKSHAECMAVAADDINGAVRVARRQTRKLVAAEHKKAQEEEARRKAVEEAERVPEPPVAAPVPAAAPRTVPKAGDLLTAARALGGKTVRRGRRVARRALKAYRR
ncbi:sulfotransferase family protein [Segeticoccus rhizosphaerae]|jgi:hypothetical protein|uniref:sulfotransferase family protein n=1 Tax=Segeticoccus rhizosphaerae TaxID=1104777 RepID=UPI0010BF8B11|nr:sulfotransferase [Ornithinicoccus soli]